MATQEGDAFLGTGWGFPMRFTNQGEQVVMTSGPNNVHRSVWILLNTQLGERVMREKFGAGLQTLHFEPIRARLINDLRRVIREAILRHEPRVKLDDVSVKGDESDDGKLIIQLRYTIKSINSRYNFVYPFYLDGTR